MIGKRTRTRFSRLTVICMAVLSSTVNLVAQWTYTPGSPSTIARVLPNGFSWVFEVDDSRVVGAVTHLTVTRCTNVPPISPLDFSGTISGAPGMTYVIDIIGDGYSAVLPSATLGAVSELTLPDTLTEIDNYAFRGASGATFIWGSSLTIPASVRRIGHSAFYDNRFNGPLTFAEPSSLTNIAINAFAQPSSGGNPPRYHFTGETRIPLSVTSIGSGAFSCNGFTRIFTPSTGVSFGNGAFSDMTSLTAVYYAGQYPASVPVQYGGQALYGPFFFSNPGYGSPNVTSYVPHKYTVSSWDAHVNPFTGSGPIHDGNATWMINRPIRCYGEVTLHGNGGQPAQQYTEITDALRYDMSTILAPSRLGHTFLGWNTLANGSGVMVGSATPYAGADDLYAKWLQEELVTFHGDGGSPDPQTAYTQSLCYDMANIIPPARPGYIFLGWTNSLGIAVVDGDPFAIGENDLTAVWLPEIPVKYYANDGTPAYQDGLTLNLCYDMTGVALPTGAVGWNTQPNGLGVTVMPGDPYTGDLYAQYVDNWDDSPNRDLTWPAPGSGQIGRNFYISSAAELAQFAWTLNNGTTYAGDIVNLKADIDLGQHWWTSAGWTKTGFNGVFDGGGYTIRGLRIGEKDRSGYYQGLFGRIAQAAISNVTLEVSSFVACGGIHSDICAGALAGSVGPDSEIVNVTVSGGPHDALYFIAGHQPGRLRAGGLVGATEGDNIHISSCVNVLPVRIAVTDAVGGMEVAAGGLVGWAEGEAYISDCKNWGAVTSADAGDCPYVTFSQTLMPWYAHVCGMGGIVGFSHCHILEITGSVNEAYIDSLPLVFHSPESGIGGIVGCAQNTGARAYIDHCHNRGDLRPGVIPNAGGIAGFIENHAVIVNCSNIGNMKGEGETMGGIVGRIQDKSWIQNCWNAGRIEIVSTAPPHIFVGGVAGDLNNTCVENCYSSSDISPRVPSTMFPNAYPLIGFAGSATRVEYCYWHSTQPASMPQNMSDGVGNWAATGNGGQWCGTFSSPPGMLNPVVGAAVLNTQFVAALNQALAMATALTPPGITLPGPLTYARWVINSPSLMGGNGYPEFGAPGRQYVVFFDVNGASVNPAYTKWIIVNAQGTLGQPITVPTHTDPNVVFQGYYYGANPQPYHNGLGWSTGVSLRGGTLTARWSVTVTFHGQGGTPGPQAVTIISPLIYSLSNITQPTRAGHVFIGWNTAADGSGVWVADGVPYAGADVYAIWAAEQEEDMRISFIQIDPVSGAVTLGWDEAHAPPSLTRIIDYVLCYTDDLTGGIWTPYRVTTPHPGLIAYTPQSTPLLHILTVDVSQMGQPPPHDNAFFKLKAVGIP